MQAHVRAEWFIIGFFALWLHNPIMIADALENPINVPLGAGWYGRVHGAGEPALSLLGSARASPFQTQGWLRAWLSNAEEACAFRLIEIMDETGSGFLLPVSIRDRGGLHLAVKPGSAHASFSVMGQIGRPDTLPPGGLGHALGRLAREAGIDAFLLADCPEMWRGASNPLLALPNHTAPDRGAHLTLDTDAESILHRLLDREARKKLRYKRTKLGEMGRLEARWASPDEAPAALNAFLGWKSRQFAALGQHDPFADTDIRGFLVRATSSDPPLIRLFQLTLDDKPIALLGGAESDRHFSGMFTAYDPSPRISRFSPGEVMLADLIADLASAGIKGFDLGVGDSRYKARYCPEDLSLRDCVLPVTAFGAVAVPIWRMGRRFKAFVKKHPRLLDYARRIKRVLPG